MAFQNTSPTTYTSPVLIGEPIQTTGGSPDALPAITNSSIALEVQSTTGAVMFPRMTTTQKNALTGSNGMMVFDTTTSTLWLYAGGWIEIESQGDVFLAGNGTVNASSYSFSARPDVGLWTSGAHILDFASNGGNQFEVQGTLNAVDYLTLTGSTTGGPVISVAGTTANAAPIIRTKGTSVFTVGPNAANSSPGGVAIQNSAGTHQTILTVTPGQLTDCTLILPDSLPGNPALPAGAETPMIVDSAGDLDFSLNGINFIKKSITTANCTTMYTTGITLIPAPGLGYMIQIHRVQFVGIFGTAALTGGGVVYLQYGIAGHSVNTASTSVAANLLTDGATTTGFATAANTAAGFFANTAFNDEPISVTNATAVFANPGTSTSTLNIFIWYSIIPADNSV